MEARIKLLKVLWGKTHRPLKLSINNNFNLRLFILLIKFILFKSFFFLLSFKKHDKMESPLSSDTSSLQKYPVESSSIVSALNNRKLSIENGLFRYSHNIANLLQKNKECQALESTSSTYFKPYKSD